MWKLHVIVLLILLFINALAVGLTSVLLVAALRQHGLLSSLISWGVGSFAIVVGAGVVLGALGQLSAVGFFWLHFVILAMTIVIRRKELNDDIRLPVTWIRHSLRLMKEDRYLRWAVLALGLFIFCTGFMAAVGQPGIYDSLTYRLSRIGHWLQEGAVAFIPTNDPRQNYMPVVPDLFMAWILGGTATGYASAALAQWAGGVLLLLATAGGGRQLGLSRAASVGAACVVAGCANVAPQFTTTQTDLITSGLLTASFFLWRANASRKEGSIVSGLAAGMALGSKGTVFYLLPSLIIWAMWYGWRSRLPFKAWRLSLLSTCLSIGVFVVPGMFRNLVHYEGVFGPEEFVVMHHHTEGGRWLEKTTLNLGAFLLQNLEPHSQMPGVAFVSKALATKMIPLLPEVDPFTFEGMGRRDALDGLINRKTPDADGTSFGILVIFLLGLGGVVSVIGWRRKGAEEIRVICLGLITFFIFFHAMQLWHPYGFRYFIIIVPWVAIVSAWFLGQLRYRVRAFTWGIVLLSSFSTSVSTLYFCHNAGRGTVFYPKQSIFSYVHLGWTDWLNELPSSGDAIHVALTFNRPLAPFYRREKSPPVRIVELSRLEGFSAEQVVSQLDGGWLITSPKRFIGNEGSVLKREWLFRNDLDSPFSIVAYRAVHVGK